MPEPTDGWHLDKRVPIAIIAALGAQTVAVAWWAATLEQRVVALEAERDARRGEITRIVRLETQLAHIGATLEKMDAKLDRLQMARR